MVKKSKAVTKDGTIVNEPVEEAQTVTVGVGRAPAPTVRKLTDICAELLGKNLPEAFVVMEDLKKQGRIKSYKTILLGTVIFENQAVNSALLVKDKENKIVDIVLN